jgi:hypothetical protein
VSTARDARSRRSAGRLGPAIFFALALAPDASLGAGARAQTRATALVLSSEDGRVLRARLASGAVVELHGEMDVRLTGATARVRFERANEDGLRATARAEDVEVRIAREIWTADGIIGLDRTARVTLRSVGTSLARVAARGLGISIREVPVPRDAIGLDARAVGTPSPAPGAWSSASTGRRRLLAASSALLRTPRGERLGATLGYGVEVAIVEEADGWARVAIEDAGVRVLAWARDGELREPPPRTTATAGGGLGDGRIGLSTCASDGARTLHARTSTPIRQRPDGPSHLVTMSAGASVVVRDGPSALVPVLELPGVQRVGRCEQPIGWVRRASLDESRGDPLDE